MRRNKDGQLLDISRPRVGLPILIKEAEPACHLPDEKRAVDSHQRDIIFLSAPMSEWKKTGSVRRFRVEKRRCSDEATRIDSCAEHATQALAAPARNRSDRFSQLACQGCKRLKKEMRQVASRVSRMLSNKSHILSQKSR
jgi:hypothetical protein